jgi:hypothetical protein
MDLLPGTDGRPTAWLHTASEAATAEDAVQSGSDRTRRSAQQVLRRLSRQDSEARNSGVVNAAIDVRKMAANCVLNETSGWGTQCACGPPKPTGRQFAGQELWANGPQRGTVQGWQDRHHQRAAVVGWCVVPFRRPESRRVPLARSQRPAE